MSSCRAPALKPPTSSPSPGSSVGLRRGCCCSIVPTWVGPWTPTWPSGGICDTRRKIRHAGRTPPAHPEGYLEAFANIYKNFANHVRARLEGRKLAQDDPALDYPGIEDGVRGMAFVEAVVKSSKKNAAWTKLEV